MTQQNVRLPLIFRFILLATFLSLNAYFFFKDYWFSFTFFLVLSLISLSELIHFIQNYLATNYKLITALLHDDFSMDLAKNSSNVTNQVLKLYEKTKTAYQSHHSKELLYHQLLNAVASGFLILKKTDDDRTIVFMNSYFQQLFGVPQSSSWNYLKKLIPQFCETLERANFEDLKTTIDIQLNGEERQTYMIQNSKTYLTDEEYDVVFLDSIQRVIDSTEKEAWMNIMKVIAHEIINSLTPIYSLAHTAQLYLANDDLSTEDYEDIRLSLHTIMNRSQHLQQFVEKYRQLTMLPTPLKSFHSLHEIVQGIELSFQAELLQKLIVFKADIPVKVTVNVDRIQFEQVLINLIKNSMYSLENSKVKSINITTKHTENRLQLIVEDSGELIDEAILSKIFLPFYTTRNNGAGIGLALSKNIIEAHNGYLYYQQTNGQKQFVVVLQKG